MDITEQIHMILIDIPVIMIIVIIIPHIIIKAKVIRGAPMAKPGRHHLKVIAAQIIVAGITRRKEDRQAQALKVIPLPLQKAIHSEAARLHARVLHLDVHHLLIVVARDILHLHTIDKMKNIIDDLKERIDHSEKIGTDELSPWAVLYNQVVIMKALIELLEERNKSTEEPA